MRYYAIEALPEDWFLERAGMSSPEIPPFVCAEGIDPVYVEGKLVLSEDEIREQYPEALEAWRRGDDSAAATLDGFLEIAVRKQAAEERAAGLIRA